MSKVNYTLINNSPNQVGVGALGFIDPGGQKVFTVEDDSVEDVLINSLIAKGAVTLASSIEALSTYGPQVATVQRDANNNVTAIKSGADIVIGTSFSFASFYTASPGVTLQTTFPVPQNIQDRGGYIYVDGSGSGGGGAGGSTDTGGGGGGGGRTSALLPVYVPPGNALLYIQAGGGGAGSAGNGAGNSTAGTGGAESYIKTGSHSGSYILRLLGGGGGNLATAAGAGGQGGATASFIQSGGVGGTGATNGTIGNPNGGATAYAASVVSTTGSYYVGGSGGGGAGNTATAGGNGGFSVGQNANGGTGSGAGGGGGAGGWGRTNSLPVWSVVGNSGKGGDGGGTPTVGSSAYADSYGGGGGGGGKGMAGGRGADGFIRIAY